MTALRHRPHDGSGTESMHSNSVRTGKLWAASTVLSNSFDNLHSALVAKQIVALIQGYQPREKSKSVPTLNISQMELARMLGVSREIVSKQLAVWREAGIVEVGRRRLTVLDGREIEQLMAGGERGPR